MNKQKETRFPVWKSVQMGRSTSHYAYQQAMKNDGYLLCGAAESVISYMVPPSGEPSIDLVRAYLKDFGLMPGATRQQILGSFDKNRLDLCPLEVGPALRLQYGEQPFGEKMILPMMPIPGFWADLRVWVVGHDGDGKWLDSRAVAGEQMHAWAHKSSWLLRQRR